MKKQIQRMIVGLAVVGIFAPRLWATETEQFARKNAPVFFDVTDVYAFPALLLQYDDRLSLSFNDGKDVNNVFGGVSFSLTNDSSIGAWINRGAGGEAISSNVNPNAAVLSRMIDLVYAWGTKDSAKGLGLFLEHLNNEGDDAWGLAFGGRFGLSSPGSDLGIGLSLNFGKPTTGADTAVGMMLDGSYRYYTHSGKVTDLILRTEPFFAMNLSPEFGMDLLLPVNFGPLVKPGLGIAVGAYTGLAMHIQKDAIAESDVYLELWGPTLGAALDWQVFEWLAFHTGVLKTWTWVLSPDDFSKTVESTTSPFKQVYVRNRDIQAVPGWNIGLTFYVKGFSLDATLATGLLRNGPNIFQSAFWENQLEGWITLSWDWGEVASSGKRPLNTVEPLFKPDSSSDEPPTRTEPQVEPPAKEVKPAEFEGWKEEKKPEEKKPEEAK